MVAHADDRRVAVFALRAASVAAVITPILTPVLATIVIAWFAGCARAVALVTRRAGGACLGHRGLGCHFRDMDRRDIG